MSKTQLSFNILVLGILFLLLLVLTHFAQPIREKLNSSRTLVAGASDVNINDIGKENFPKALAEDAKDQVSQLKDQAMNITLSQILDVVSRGQKIPQDLESAKQNIESYIKGLR